MSVKRRDKKTVFFTTVKVKEQTAATLINTLTLTVRQSLFTAGSLLKLMQFRWENGTVFL